MYAYISGTIDYITENSVVVDNHGVGYEISMSGSDLGVIHHGDEVKIYTHYHVSDNGIGLYGFLSRETKRVFELLLSVNGVGPKGALAVLSVLSVEDLTYAVLGDNEKAITAAPGIGPKAAKKIILELKDKLDLNDAVSETLDRGSAAASINNSIKNNVLMGLTALGFSSSDALRALNSIEITDDMTEEELLKAALKNING
ncbi:MAG: Holliday junction branch migration protein RuvA [Lachnospiraceae bacterium]|nr:Holliday junction branch migration protein RuvA [Lachnospiraceae bacterium]